MSSTTRNITSNFVSLGIIGTRNSKSSVPSPAADVVNVAAVVAPVGMKVTKAAAGVSAEDQGAILKARSHTPLLLRTRPISGARWTIYVAFALAFLTRTLMSAAK